MLDDKDKIIFQQLEVIRSMTQNNLRRIGQDFFGDKEEPASPESTENGAPKPAESAPVETEGAKEE